MANIIKSKLDADQVIRRAYDDDKNRLRVDAEVEAVISSVDVVIDAASGDNIAISNQAGTEYVEVTGGALHVVVDNLGALTTKNIFDEVTNIPPGVTTTILTHNVIAEGKLLKVDVAGTNIAMYSVYIQGIIQSKKYTMYTHLNTTFEFDNGILLNPGDIVEIEVVHQRPSPADFNCNIIIQN